MRSETAETLKSHSRKEQQLSKKRARPAKPTEQEQKIKISTKTDGSMVYNRHKFI
jgi:hypothetical protein